jgi:hypothetical protein
MWHCVIWWYKSADVSEKLHATSFYATPIYFYHIWRCYTLEDSNFQICEWVCSEKHNFICITRCYILVI